MDKGDVGMKKRGYIIYQAPRNVEYTFMGFDFAMKHNWSKGDYVAVWRGVVETETVNEALEELFEIFNIRQPDCYYARSLSVSDVVLLDGQLYYCDRIGWSEIPKEKYGR